MRQKNFRIIITYDRALSGKIIDLAFGEEYVNFRMESATGYSAEVRNKFEALLLDIRDKCCKNQFFQSEQARRINEFIRAYKASGEEFSEDGWCTMVEKVTVWRDKMVFTLTTGVEIEV